MKRATTNEAKGVRTAPEHQRSSLFVAGPSHRSAPQSLPLLCAFLFLKRKRALATAVASADPSHPPWMAPPPASAPPRVPGPLQKFRSSHSIPAQHSASVPVRPPAQESRACSVVPQPTPPTHAQFPYYYSQPAAAPQPGIFTSLPSRPTPHTQSQDTEERPSPGPLYELLGITGVEGRRQPPPPKVVREFHPPPPRIVGEIPSSPPRIVSATPRPCAPPTAPPASTHPEPQVPTLFLDNVPVIELPKPPERPHFITPPPPDSWFKPQEMVARGAEVDPTLPYNPWEERRKR